MELYEQFFDREALNRPYGSNQEAVDDMLALVDLYLNMVFYNRDATEERLDMRGVVITPQEFNSALTDRILRVRNMEDEQERLYSHSIAAEARAAAEHVKRRAEATGAAGTASSGLSPAAPPVLRPFRLMECLNLSPLECFCFCLALAGEYDRKYERIFGYAQDNVGARQPTVGLGLSLYRMGLGPEGRQKELWIPEDSPLWLYLLKDTLPPEGESGLSRPMAPRHQVLRFLKEGALIPKNWKSFTCPTDSGSGENRLRISISGILEFCRGFRSGAAAGFGGEAAGAGDSGARCGLACEILSWLSLAARYQNSAITFDGPSSPPDPAAPDPADDLRCLSFYAGRLGLGSLPINRLGACASPVNADYHFEDLVLEESQKRLLVQICSQVKYRDLVMEQWGFRCKSPYGNGISALFYGAPGTGKTMAAQIIGNELGMETYKIDLSRMLSKYIGETEKNLEEMFRRARERQVILFFDEADGLFAKRTSVGSSNDRYANTETGYLLQRLEEYEGIVILATNFINNIDEAFKRRIRFFVKFTFPGQAMRLQLWKSMLPEAALVAEELSFSAFAARFELSGSDIRSVITGGAYLAAAAGRGIRNEDIQESLRVHYLKMGRKLGEAELRL